MVQTWLQDFHETYDLIERCSQEIKSNFVSSVDNSDVTPIEKIAARRSLEAKLIRLFSKLLYLKLRNDALCADEDVEDIGNANLWLCIFNIDAEKQIALKEEIGDVVDLLQLTRKDLASLSDRCGFSHEEKCRFVHATLRLRVYTKKWLEIDSEPVKEFSDESLSWLDHHLSPEPVSRDFSPLLSIPSFARGVPNVFRRFGAENSLQDPSIFPTAAGPSKRHAALPVVHRSTKSAVVVAPSGGAATANRRSLSVSESGVDSCASDSGVGSNVSQNSLPTTTPPPSPCWVVASAGVGGGSQASTSTRGPASDRFVVVGPQDPYSKRRVGGTTLRSVVNPRTVPAAAAGAAPAPVPLCEMMRSRSHESNLQARLLGTTQDPVLSSSSRHLQPPSLTATTATGDENAAAPATALRGSGVRKSATFAVDGAAAAAAVGDDVVVPPAEVVTSSSLRKPASCDAVQQQRRKTSQSKYSPSLDAPVAASSSATTLPRLYLGASADAAPSTSGALADILLPVPKSPRVSELRMDHRIRHRFNRMWKPSMDHCHVCSKTIGIGGERCQDCRVKVHSGCKDLVDDSCGFTTEQKRRIFDELLCSFGPTAKRSPSSDSSAALASPSPTTTFYAAAAVADGGRSQSTSLAPTSFYSPWLTGGDSASSSSCNSSAPSTPAFGAARPPNAPSSLALGSSRTKFTFPDPISQPDVPFIHVDESEISDSRLTTTVTSVSSGDNTTLYDSRDGSALDNRLSPDCPFPHSAASLPPPDTNAKRPDQHLVDSLGSIDSFSGHQWQRNKWTMSTIRGASSSWREWTILYEDLKFPEGSLLGKGRFGEVHRAYWHQDVAVKLLNMDHVSDDRQLEAFKQEISTFRHTRHENLVLFVGCCLIPPHLGIVMNLCKGQTLYTLLHIRRDRFDMNRIINFAIQLSQGMSYLHGRKIIHKDLRTKNIFVENNNKIVITDFSLFSIKRLCPTSFSNFDIKGLNVPERWLCYLAPELMRTLKTWRCLQEVDEPEFTECSDVYAFGTVWYELLSYEFPYKKLPTDSIIWHCCKGLKPGLNNLPVAREIKDVLIQCWAFKPDDRPNFHQLLKVFEKLPKKRLERSPSQPVHLSRSAESIF